MLYSSHARPFVFQRLLALMLRAIHLIPHILLPQLCIWRDTGTSTGRRTAWRLVTEAGSVRWSAWQAMACRDRGG